MRGVDERASASSPPSSGSTRSKEEASYRCVWTGGEDRRQVERSSAPSRSTWSRCCSMPSRSPPKNSTASSGPRPVGLVVPARGHGPVGRGRRRRPSAPSRREAVGEDLVDDALGVPVRGGRCDADHEVEVVGHVVAEDARRRSARRSRRRRRRAATGSAVGFQIGTVGPPPHVGRRSPRRPRPARRAARRRARAQRPRRPLEARGTRMRTATSSPISAGARDVQRRAVVVGSRQGRRGTIPSPTPP